MGRCVETNEAGEQCIIESGRHFSSENAGTHKTEHGKRWPVPGIFLCCNSILGNPDCKRDAGHPGEHRPAGWVAPVKDGGCAVCGPPPHYYSYRCEHCRSRYQLRHGKPLPYPFQDPVSVADAVTPTWPTRITTPIALPESAESRAYRYFCGLVPRMIDLMPREQKELLSVLREWGKRWPGGGK